MPELPDVQVFKEYLDATALHQRIEGVHLRDADRLEEVSDSTIRRRLTGRELTGTRRHGKHLFAAIGDDGGWLRLHFGMTGRLAYWKDGGAPDHAVLVLDFPDDRHLAFVNTRKFGEIGIVDDVDAFVEERDLGPDALADDFDADAFRAAIDGRRGSVKTTLMDQATIAGLGNVYVDEILFQAGIHPEAEVADLDDDDATGSLHRVMRRVLRKAIDVRVEEFPDGWLLPRREEGAECPRCGGSIAKAEVGGRPTYFCPDHQPAP